jgi:hypothetical protein
VTSEPKEEHSLMLFEIRVLREILVYAEKGKDIRIEKMPRRRIKWGQLSVKTEETSNSRRISCKKF